MQFGVDLQVLVADGNGRPRPPAPLGVCAPNDNDLYADALICVACTPVSGCELSAVLKCGHRDESVVDGPAHDPEAGQDVWKTSPGLRRQNERRSEATCQKPRGIPARQARVARQARQDGVRLGERMARKRHTTIGPPSADRPRDRCASRPTAELRRWCRVPQWTTVGRRRSVQTRCHRRSSCLRWQRVPRPLRRSAPCDRSG